MPIIDVLNALEREERAFLAAEVVAPVLRGRRVGVRIAGVVLELRVDDRQFEGWALLRPLALDRARIVRPARLAEVAAYLRLFPGVRLIALPGDGRRWYALPAQRDTPRLHLAQPARVALVEEGVQAFETLLARFDGRFFWYERRDSSRNPALAAYLRAAFAAERPVEALRRAGLSAEERAAYAWARQALAEARASEAARRAQRERVASDARLADALAHAGAQLLAFIERGDRYTVTYTVDGARHVSAIRKGDLGVLTSGVCLSGRDDDFDLTSLVGVLREGEARDLIVPLRLPMVGDEG